MTHEPVRCSATPKESIKMACDIAEMNGYRNPVLYLLIKTHKFLDADDLASINPTSVKVRPIISCVGGPTDRIAWFLNTILVQLLKFIPSHLTNTQMFLDRLGALHLTGSCVMESFDVEALYTNVSNGSAMEAVVELLSQHQSDINMRGLSISQLMALVNECLSCNIFKWSGRYFAQTRGLAMGQRLAPVLAIAFMAKIEAPVHEYLPLLYCRYIDDCFIVCATQKEIDVCFDLLNSQSEHIKLTREKPTGNWLPFLNVQVRLHGDTMITKWYRKPSNKNIIVHYYSAHPFYIKRAVVRNMFRTAKKVCTGEDERKESIKMACDIAEMNGYRNFPTTRRAPSGGVILRHGSTSIDGKIPFVLPFISDEVSATIRKCLKRSGLENVVTIVNVPPLNLKKRLVRNRLYDRLCTTSNCVVCTAGREGDCNMSGVVYKITCRDCGDEYIGETARPLHVRVKEHIDGMKRLNESTALGSHRIQKHNGGVFEVTVEVVAQESQLCACKTLEAFWIQVTDPKMNRREECLAITRELRPYIKLAFP
uniref:Reverse transcriptase domain-containing protein n=1 Tax=Haemonchus contortus TaxID=6289 RepID=A0A7I4Y8Y3_HAECO